MTSSYSLREISEIQSIGKSCTRKEYVKKALDLEYLTEEHL